MSEAASQGSSQGSSQEHQIDPFDPVRKLGIVSQVRSAVVELIIDATTGAPADVGQYLLIDGGDFAIFAQLAEVKLVPAANGRAADQTVGTAKLLSTIDVRTWEATLGVYRSPSVGSTIYVAHPEVARFVAESRKRRNDPDAPPEVELALANLKDPEKTPISITADQLFGRHCAVLGTTGSGKSWTLAKIVEEAARYRSKIIFFDATGEFGTLEGPVAHVYLGKHPNPPIHFREVVLPYHELMESDLFAIFKPTGQSQAPKLRAAIKSLKLAALVPSVALDGMVMKANKSKQHYEESYLKNIVEIEKPNANFEMTKLIRQIQNECVNPNRSALEPQYWGDINGLEAALCTPLVNRIQDILNSVNLAPIFDPEEKPSLLNAIEQFLEHPTLRILCISLQYLSFQHSAREIIANATGRYLMQLAQKERFRRRPLLLVVDEAHQFLNEALERSDNEYPLNSFAIIAKEGRKYALGICLATQRPRDIPESVLSQMGTMIVHRLISDRDQDIVSRAIGGADTATLSVLPVLSPGDALIVGADFTAPLSVRISPPQFPPVSAGPDYQRFWQ